MSLKIWLRRKRQMNKLYLLIAVSMFVSCKSTKYVTVPEYHEVVVHQRDTISRWDSIYVKDSVAVLQRGDTMFVDRWHTINRDRWRDRVRVDSVAIRDTVTVVRYADSSQSSGVVWYEKILIAVGQMCCIAIIICLLFSYLKKKE